MWRTSSPGTQSQMEGAHISVRDNWGERKAKNKRSSAALELPVLWGLEQRFQVPAVHGDSQPQWLQQGPVGCYCMSCAVLMAMFKHAFSAQISECLQATGQAQCKNSGYGPAEGDCEPAQCSRDGHGVEGK